jgi:hypothetical protein
MANAEHMLTKFRKIQNMLGSFLHDVEEARAEHPTPDAFARWLIFGGLPPGRIATMISIMKPDEIRVAMKLIAPLIRAEARIAARSSSPTTTKTADAKTAPSPASPMAVSMTPAPSSCPAPSVSSSSPPTSPAPPTPRKGREEENRRYRTSDKGRKARMRYWASDKGQETRRRHQASDKAAEASHRYAASGKRRAAYAARRAALASMVTTKE